MKTLILVRHAKSERSDENLADIDRPLHRAGYVDAHKISSRLNAQNLLPDLIIASAAIRTTSTALIFARNTGYHAGGIRLVPELYNAGMETYLKEIREIGADKEIIYLVGHNPTITQLANFLGGRFTTNLVTCSVVRIDFDIDSWRAMRSGRLIFHFYPQLAG